MVDVRKHSPQKEWTKSRRHEEECVIYILQSVKTSATMLQVKLMEVRVCFFCITTVCIEFNACSSLHKCVFMHGHWKTQNQYQTHMQGCIYSHVWGHKLTVSATLCVCVMFCYSYCLIKVMWIEGLTCSELFIPAAAWHLHWPRVWKRIHPPNTHTHRPSCMHAHTKCNIALPCRIIQPEQL